MNALEQLRKVQSKLDPEQVIDALDRVLAAWREPESPWRARLAREHGVYSREVLERGTLEGLRGWTGQALRSLRARELREPCWAPPVTAVWLAGSIPTASFHALLLPLLAGSTVCVKPASHDALSAQLFLESVRALAPEIADAIIVGDNPEWLDTADAVVAHGSDETIAVIRARVPAQRIFVGHGHKLSLAVIGREVELDAAAQAAALDIALYDGRGCLSPAYLLVLDQPRGRATLFARALARALARLASELPRGHLTQSEQLALRELRARAALRAGVELEMSAQGTDWTVILEAAGSRPPPGLLRCVPVIPLADASELERWCGELAPHLSSLGHAGWSQPHAELTRAVAQGGGSRVCPLGRMQYPPLDWNHDGMSPLRSLLRLIGVEEA